MPESLDDLGGPQTGSITLPVSIFWVPGSKTIPLVDDGNLVMAYQAVIAEGSAVHQQEFLNRDLLVRVWPRLNLPIKAARQWQERFPELRGNPRAEIEHAR